MKLDPGIHIVMHSVLSLKPGVTRTFSEQRFRRPALARAVRAALAMGTAESRRWRRERSPKQEYLDQVLKCVLMRGGRGVYIGVATNLDVVKSFDERQLLV